MTVVQRYFLNETVKTFLFCLMSFFALFVLIDYTNRGSHFHLAAADLATYYGYLFVRRVEILAPFALLIAVMRTLCNANMRHELTATKASGIAPQTILKPLLGLGLVITGLLYLNTELLLPSSLKFIHKVQDEYEMGRTEKRQEVPVQHIALDDQSHILYGTYDTAHKQLVSAYWIRTVDDIYRIKFLSPSENPPVGHFVDRLTRNEQGLLIPSQSWETLDLTEMKIDFQKLSEVLIPPSDRSLTTLWQQLATRKRALTMEEAQINAAFYRKLTMPWLCLLALLAPIPTCVRFRRPLPVFFLYAVALFCLISFYLVLSAGDILAQSQVLAPVWALLVPTAACVGVALWRYSRIS